MTPENEAIVPAAAQRQEMKVAENRLRRMAARQNLRLQRSPLRDRHALGYGTYRLYRADGTLAAGCDDRGNDFGLTMTAVEEYLTGDRKDS